MAERDDTENTPAGPGAPDLEGVRRTREDVGALPVPRSVLEERARRALRQRPQTPYRGTPPDSHGRDAEARLRRALPHAARTPEELGRALARLGPLREDPQRGHEGGPPLPGEPGLEGDGEG